MYKKLFSVVLLTLALCAKSLAGNNSLLRYSQTFCLGKKSASAYYQEKINEFLKYAHIYTPAPVYQLEPCGPVDFFLDSSTLLGFTTIYGIWLNEKQLNKISEAERLFTLAHEVAHFALHHPRTILTDYVYAGAGSFVALIGLTSWDREQEETTLLKTIMQLTIRTTKSCCLLAFVYSFLFANKIKTLTITLEKEADLKAARLLWEHGYQQVVVEHVKALKTLIAKGFGCSSDNQHPTIFEEYRYLSAFIAQQGTFTA